MVSSSGRDRAASIQPDRIGKKLMIRRSEHIRLLQQALKKLGYSSVADRLEEESVSCSNFPLSTFLLSMLSISKLRAAALHTEVAIFTVKPLGKMASIARLLSHQIQLLQLKSCLLPYMKFGRKGSPLNSCLPYEYFSAQSETNQFDNMRPSIPIKPCLSAVAGH